MMYFFLEKVSPRKINNILMLILLLLEQDIKNDTFFVYPLVKIWRQKLPKKDFTIIF